MDPLPKNAPPLLFDLHGEVREVVARGLPHTSLSMIAILLEATLREVLRKKNGKYPTGATFNKCIFLAKGQKIVSEKEAEWLRKMNNLVRNSYLHHDVERIAENIKLAELDPQKKQAFDRFVAQELFKEVDGFMREMVAKYF